MLDKLNVKIIGIKEDKQRILATSISSLLAVNFSQKFHPIPSITSKMDERI